MKLRKGVQKHVQKRGQTDWEQGYFVQDDFKVSSRLTLNLGLRYEIIAPFTESNDIMANFDPNYVSPTGTKGRFVIPSKATLTFLDPRIQSYGYVLAGDIGLPRSLVHTDYGKLAPRLGVASRLTDKTVIRGGYGFFFPTSAAQGMRDAMATNPFNQGRTENNTAATPLSPWPTRSRMPRTRTSRTQPGAYHLENGSSQYGNSLQLTELLR